MAVDLGRGQTPGRRGMRGACRPSTICLLAALLPAVLGCPFSGVPETLMPYDFATDPDGDGSLETARPVRWFGDFAVATGGISLDPANGANIQSFLAGEIVGNHEPPPSEIDCWSLGELAAGDAISVSVTSLTELIAGITPAAQSTAFLQGTRAAFFMLTNAQGETVGFPAARPIVIETPGQYYLVVANHKEYQIPFDYRMTIQRLRNQPPAAARRGVLLLQFDGARDVGMTFGDPESFGLRTIDDLPPFDWSEVRPDLPGLGERFMQTVRQIVEFAYADYDVRVTLDADEAAQAGHYDTLVFLSKAPTDLGFAVGAQVLGEEPLVDVEDRAMQVGVVYVRRSNEYCGPTDFGTYCLNWGVIAAHEYGHAVGLFHVEQASESLMSPLYGLCERRFEPLRRAREDTVRLLIQDPDRYLARVLGRRDAAEARAIRERMAAIMPELVP